MRLTNQNAASQHPVRRFARTLLPACRTLVVLLVMLLVAAPALAAPKKKVVEEVPTKSYTTPYLIVIVLISVGVMAICRPSSRADKLDDKKKSDKDE
jgi:hypothetical protein